MEKLYCPECRGNLEEVIVISGDEKIAIWDKDRQVFVYDHESEVSTVYLCPDCGANLSNLVEVDMEVY